ncbi:hypothetical protein CYMTET_53714 [Cymbomonas tetramitiformis]|uniref:Uncharacterized protein n=1 Tax=Cymbomonas tetramitiformis TaxID=36881 RepID=A0AAE0EPF6_9CHLO|nr:hypothetical protein CYMTET_53714 [Cymbomonas tetramitiformis]
MGKEREHALYAEAVEYCIDNECMGFKAILVPNFKGLDPRSIGRKWTAQLAHHGASNRKASRDDKKVLTKVEEGEVVEWLVACNKVKEGKARDELGEKICEVLTCRKKLYEVSRGRKAQALSSAAKMCLKNGKPSVKWFQRFYKRYASVLSENHKHKHTRNLAFSDFRPFGLRPSGGACGDMVGGCRALYTSNYI